MLSKRGMYLLGIDPGRAKYGLALVYHQQGTIEPIYLNVSPLQQLETELQQLLSKWPVDQVVLGDGTGKEEIYNRLSNFFSSKTAIKLVDERNSSQQARTRYWQANPAKGLWKLIPTSLRVPPEPFDQYVALILIERHLAAIKGSKEDT